MTNVDSPVGCLLVHGLGSSPFEMEPLAAALEAAGCVVRNLTLPGHDATVEEYARSRYPQWLDHLLKQFDDLKAETGRVAVIGMSLGGSLVLDLATRRKPVALVCIAASVRLYRIFPWQGKDWRLPLVPFLQHLKPVWPLGPPNPASRAIAPWQGYEGVMALKPLASYIKALGELRRNLGRVAAPILVLHSPEDRTAHVNNAWEILRGVGSSVRRLELLPIRERVTGHHLLTTHEETRDKVAEMTVTFVKRFAGQRGNP